METKKDIMNFIKSEIENNNTVIYSSIGNGGCGLCVLDLVNIENFLIELENYKFEGVASEEETQDIKSSKYYDPFYKCYKFVETSEKPNPYKIILAIPIEI